MRGPGNEALDQRVKPKRHISIIRHSRLTVAPLEKESGAALAVPYNDRNTCRFVPLGTVAALVAARSVRPRTQPSTARRQCSGGIFVKAICSAIMPQGKSDYGLFVISLDQFFAYARKPTIGR